MDPTVLLSARVFYAGPMTIDVLLTGFEPFGGAEVNESWQAVTLAVPLLREAGLQVQARELPVVFGRAGELLAEAVEQLQPRVVVATGLAAGRRAVTPERVAINVRDARIPDNVGASPVDEPCATGGPVGYFSTLPIKAMVQACRDELGLPAAVSQTAGTFVCNDVFYLLQHLAAQRATQGTKPDEEGAAPVAQGSPAEVCARTGFIHVPAAADLAVQDTARALARMVEVAVHAERDVAIGGGAEH